MQPQLWGIFMRPLVDLLRAADVAFSEPTLRFYPDGSVLTRTDCDFYRQARSIIRQTEGWEPMTWLRPLAPFGQREYVISYPGWYGALVGKYEEMHVMVVPGGLTSIWEREYDISEVRVWIQLHRKFARGVPEELAEALKRWFATIGSKGALGEVGVSSLSQLLQYLGKDATFSMDASRSGEHTLNSLILAILSWGMAGRRPLRWIDLAPGRPPAHRYDEMQREYEELLRSSQSVPLM